MGRNPEKSSALALPLWRSGYGEARGGARAHLSRSVLERVLATPSRFSEAARIHYAKLYAMSGAMHSGFIQFAAFDQDAKDNQAFLAKGKLTMPVLAIGGRCVPAGRQAVGCREASFGKTMAEIKRFAASNVRERVIPNSGHWIMEENPMATIAIVPAFLDLKL
jgi:pimeloyl-ACP methyl ester carboxylesterase